MTTMAGFRCWEAAAAQQTVYSDIGALPADADALFLAAHTPMALKHTRGEEVADSYGDERDVLHALLANTGDNDRNTIVAVTGGSGTGKSHVVRWVHAHLRLTPDRFHVLYVPRAIQTIRDLLRRIVEGLPGDHGTELMARVDTAIGKFTPAELRDKLLEDMRFALTWSLKPKEAAQGETSEERDARNDRNSLLGTPDGDGKRRHGLADLLSVGPINQALLTPDGTLDRIVNSLYTRTSRRDEQSNRLTVADLPLRTRGIRSALRGNEELDELWTQVGMEPEQAVDVLNEALQEALPVTLGLRGTHGETLDMLFQHARQLLRGDGKELVLLFEDLAQFGLIDGELYDQFVIQPRDDKAPLRALFAVTDEPFARIVNTVGTRITHRFEIKDGALADRGAFIARYLNLVRLGRSEVEQAWHRAHRNDEDDWVKNACDAGPDGEPCPLRRQCHEGFGTIDVPGLGAVGLYPYNKVALRRALDRPTENPCTPRSDLDECVSATLNEAHAHLRQGNYPHERTFTRFDSTVQQPKDALLGGKTGSDAERLYRALVLWGDEQPLPPAVIDAFQLDGATPAEAQVSTASRTTTDSLAAVTSPATSLRHEPSAPPRQAKPLLDSPLPALFQWQNGAPIRDQDIRSYRKILHQLVTERLNLEADFIHVKTGLSEDIFRRFFNVTSFDFGEETFGRAAGRESIRFTLGPDRDDVKVLAAARWFDDHGHWAPENGMWPWPTGYDAVDLMLSLEKRLDEWAEAVRDEFIRRRDVRRIACAAVASRAIALMCAGSSAAEVRHVHDALSSVPVMVNATDGWVPVDQLARNLLANKSVLNLVGEFAAVRQGSTGDPQLIDTATLERDLECALASPTEYLRGVVADLKVVEPVLAENVTNLLRAVEKEGAAMTAEALRAVNFLTDNLGGAKPATVSKAADEIGLRAVKVGFFRPEDGLADFEKAVHTLGETLPNLPLTWRPTSNENDDAITIQHWARRAVTGANALRSVRHALTLTQAECLRNTPESGDLQQREEQVYRKLDRMEELLRGLREGGATDA